MRYLRCLPECLHSATISTILKDYNTQSMLQSLPFNVNITNKITTFIRFMRSACSVVILGKNGSSCIFTSSGIMPIPKIFIKVTRGATSSKSVQFVKFRLSEDTTVYRKSISFSNLTRNESLELVLEHTLRLSLSYFWTFDPYVLFYLLRVIKICK